MYRVFTKLPPSQGRQGNQRITISDQRHASPDGVHGVYSFNGRHRPLTKLASRRHFVFVSSHCPPTNTCWHVFDGGAGVPATTASFPVGQQTMLLPPGHRPRLKLTEQVFFVLSQHCPIVDPSPNTLHAEGGGGLGFPVPVAQH